MGIFEEINAFEYFTAFRDGDSINFDVMYYNGGCGLNEALKNCK